MAELSGPRSPQENHGESRASGQPNAARRGPFIPSPQGACGRGGRESLRMATKRFKEKIVDGQMLFDNVAPRLTDLPQLAADHTALGTALTQARELQGQQELAKGHLRELNKRRQEVAIETAKVRRRLAVSLQAALGEDSTTLLEFGIKPRPTTRRPRVILTPAEKAARAAERASAKAAELAKQQSVTSPPAPPVK